MSAESDSTEKPDVVDLNDLQPPNRQDDFEEDPADADCPRCGNRVGEPPRRWEGHCSYACAIQQAERDGAEAERARIIGDLRYLHDNEASPHRRAVYVWLASRWSPTGLKGELHG